MDDLEEIKRAVSTKQFYEPIAAEPLPHEVVDLERMVEETPKIAPVFVRVDRYKEILSHIQGLKSTISNLENILAVRKHVHKINADSDEILENALKKFADSTNMFSREFVTPRGPEQFARGNEKSENAFDNTVSQLGDEIVKLKQELEKIKL
jgi:glutaredoxin 2